MEKKEKSEKSEPGQGGREAWSSFTLADFLGGKIGASSIE